MYAMPSLSAALIPIHNWISLTTTYSAHLISSHILHYCQTPVMPSLPSPSSSKYFQYSAAIGQPQVHAKSISTFMLRAEENIAKSRGDQGEGRDGESTWKSFTGSVMKTCKIFLTIFTQ